MPSVPNVHALFVLLLTAVALVLFSRERIPLATSALAILTTLILFFQLFPFVSDHHPFSPAALFVGFSDPALIAIVGLMIVGQGVVTTGALVPIGRVLARFWAWSPALAFLLTLILASLLSAFVNNTPIVILLLPLLTAIALRTQAFASRLLMPMGFATLIGGMGTTIGTSTNLIVMSVAQKMGLPPMGMFSFTEIAALGALVGITYLWLIAPRILPQNDAPLTQSSPRLFTARLILGADSPLVGAPLSQARTLLAGGRLTAVLRGDGVSLSLLPDLLLREQDILVVQDRPENLKEHESALGATLWSGESHDPDSARGDEDRQLAEIVITPTSRLAGNSLANSFFEIHYDLTPIGLYQRGLSHVGNHDLDRVILNAGDIVLVEGTRTKIAETRRKGRLLLLDATTDLPRNHKASLALVIMGLVVALAALNILPIELSAVAGVLAMLITRCLAWDDFVDAIRPDVILIIAASLALSLALTVTGGSAFLAATLRAWGHGLSPTMMIAILLLLMAVIANLASHVVAAVIGTPVAIDLANSFHVAPIPFVLAVLFGANLCFATPMAYQTNLLVMSAGGYRFSDFLRVGLPLVALLIITFTSLLAWRYHLPITW